MTDAREMVLLVDDETLVRMAAADLLEEAGCRVIEAACADEALQWLTADPGAIEVLVTDVHMPGSMDGLDLARVVVHRQWPWIRLIVVSGLRGYSDRDLPDHGRFVAKPWRIDRMVDAIAWAGHH